MAMKLCNKTKINTPDRSSWSEFRSDSSVLRYIDFKLDEKSTPSLLFMAYFRALRLDIRLNKVHHSIRKVLISHEASYCSYRSTRSGIISQRLKFCLSTCLNSGGQRGPNQAKIDQNYPLFQAHHSIRKVQISHILGLQACRASTAVFPQQ